MKTHIVATAVAAILVGSAGMAYAEVTDVEVGLIKADVNGDQALSQGEVVLDAMEGFVASDLDGDGILAERKSAIWRPIRSSPSNDAEQQPGGR